MDILTRYVKVSKYLQFFILKANNTENKFLTSLTEKNTHNFEYIQFYSNFGVIKTIICSYFALYYIINLEFVEKNGICFCYKNLNDIRKNEFRSHFLWDLAF